MADKAPAFQFYPKDFLTDARVVVMSNTEVGIYVRLLCFCWLEGTLPLETHALAHMAKTPLKQFTKVWERSIVRTCFTVADDGRLHHKRLDEERRKQGDFSRRQSDKGKASAAAKLASLAQPDVNRTSTDVALVVPPEGNSSSPSPSASPISTLQTPVSLSERVIAGPDVRERAGRLLENFSAWFSELRQGAQTRLLRNTLEFEDACDLCRHWPDARLEQLAKIVLTTDDAWIERTDRSFKIFARKASWADDRLRQWEAKQAVGV